MMNLRNLVLITSLIALHGCSKLPKIDEVLTDKRTTYQKSRDLPALEVPPDLTVTEGQYKATIPGEQESTSLSEFERQRDQRLKRGNVVLGTGQEEGEQWIALQGTSVDVWPKLREFWATKGYTMDLDDAELGILETNWKEDALSRDKFMVFAEPDESGLILFLSSARQELSEGEWLESSPDLKNEKETLRELNLHFYGTAIPRETESTVSSSAVTSSSASSSTAPASRPSRSNAEVLDIGEGRVYLAIPQEFTRAWRDTEIVIERAGLFIESKDQEKGTYNFIYFKPETEEEEGLLSKLKFWGNDEDEEGTRYQLSLTGVGDKTEAIVMNEDGDWATSDDAVNILNALRNEYNRL